MPTIRFAAIPDGKPYPPFHDVQCMVEGEAAVALGEIAAARWAAAGCTAGTLRSLSRAIVGRHQSRQGQGEYKSVSREPN